jgi:hypothetical protein
MPMETQDALTILRQLMMADNLGDVHDAINRMHRMLGLPEPVGDFLDGWTDDDLRRVGADV